MRDRAHRTRLLPLRSRRGLGPLLRHAVARLHAQTSREDELADRGAEAAQERVERLHKNRAKHVSQYVIPIHVHFSFSFRGGGVGSNGRGLGRSEETYKVARQNTVDELDAADKHQKGHECV